MSITEIPTALAALGAGRPIIVVDNESRENEGDLIIAAQFATPGVARVHDPPHLGVHLRADEPRARRPTRAAAHGHGQPGPAAHRVHDLGGCRRPQEHRHQRRERSHTLRVLADINSTPASLNRPGHILPLRAMDGGVRSRAGHTEATVDLLKLAELIPVGAIGEIVQDDGEMMRLPALIAFGEEHDIPIITIESLIAYLQEWHCDSDIPLSVEIPESPRAIFEVETNVPTEHGAFRFRAYRDRQTGADHLAIIKGEPKNGTLLRVHSECLTGEVFASEKCECGPQLDAALDAIQEEGGIVIYMRGHEGRGIGLINKLKAYRLQEDGLDTLDANLALGFPADGRDYGAAVSILEDLGISEVRAITNNPEKLRQLGERGITVIDRVPLVVGVGEFNEKYLEAKRDRMGHVLPDDATLDDAVLAGQKGGDK